MIALALALCGTESKSTSADMLSPAETLINLPRPIVIGHRGFNQIAPENTLPSFKLAKMAGSDLVELDYYKTQDGKMVVIHDAVLDRTTDAVARWAEKGIRVNRRTADDLASLDAGAWFDQKHAGSDLPKYRGTHLPTLAEALDLIQDGNMTLIERKEGDATSCLKLLREKNLVNKLVVQSFDWNYLKDFHQQEPQQVLGALGPLGSRNGKELSSAEKVLDKSWLDEVKAIGARVAVWNNQITRQAVDYAHETGLKVWVYTINEPSAVNQMLDLGVDGIITDNTSILWKTIALRNSPPSRPAPQLNPKS